MVNFKIYDVTDWTTNIYNTHIAQYLKKYRRPDNEIWSEYKMRNIFLGQLYKKNNVEKLVPDLSRKNQN